MKDYSPKICPICGAEFKPTSPSQKYCTRECSAIAEHRRDQIRHHRRQKRGRPPKEKLETFTRPTLRVLTDDVIGKDPGAYARRQIAETVEKYARIDLTAAPAPIEPPRERETVKILRDALEAEQTKRKAEQTKRKAEQAKRKVVEKSRQTLAERFEKLKREHEAALRVCDILKHELEDLARAYAITR